MVHVMARQTLGVLQCHHFETFCRDVRGMHPFSAALRFQIQCTFNPAYSHSNCISAQKSSFGQMDRALNSSPVPVTNVLDLSPKTTTVSQKAFFSGMGSRGEAYLEVKDVPKDVTKEELIEFFSKYGRVSACRLNTGRTGIIHAYVYYSAIDELNCAMDDLPHIFGGKPLNTMFKNVGHYNSAPLFVGSLPENVTEETLRDEFSKYGKLVYWKLENDENVTEETLREEFSKYGKLVFWKLEN
ncbi:RNA recognition motif domain-containing protein [Ditylenchus destructor]|nr:RNA recognition motif domain-containing protein [Ditylenchus destructor]